MEFKTELTISILLMFYLIIEIVRHFVFNNDKWALFTGLISMLSLGYGVYLWIYHGIILDYYSPKEIAENNSETMIKIGLALIVIALLFIVLSVLYSFLERLGIIKRKIKD